MVCNLILIDMEICWVKGGRASLLADGMKKDKGICSFCRGALVGWMFVFFCFLAMGGVGFARGLSGESALKVAELKARIQQLSEDSVADEDAQAALVDYQEALRLVKDAEEAEARTSEFQRKAVDAPNEIEKLAEEIPEFRGMNVPEDASLEKVENAFNVANATLSEAKAELKARNRQAREIVTRQSALPALMAAAKNDLAALVRPETPIATSPESVKSAYQRALAQSRLLREQISMFEAEMEYLETAPALVSAEAGLLSRKIAVLTDLTDALRGEVEEMRIEEAGDEIERATERARSFAEGSAEREVADEVVDLVERQGGRNGLSERIAESAAQAAEIEERVEEISRQFSSARERVELLEDVGVRIDPATGRLLRTQRQKMPSTGELTDVLQEVVESSAQVQIERLVLDDRYSALLAESAMDENASPELVELKKERLAALRSLIRDYRSYIKNLREMVTQVRDLIEVSEEFAVFVDRRLLWIPSLGRIQMDEIRIEVSAYREFFRREPFVPLGNDLRKRPYLWCLAALGIGGLALRRRFFRRRLRAVGRQASKKFCTSFLPTALALLYSALLALPLPLAAWFLYLRCYDCGPAVEGALRSVASFLTLAIFFRILCQRNGVLVKHLQMSERRVAVIRQSLNWLIPIMPVFLFFAVALPNHAGAVSGGRLTFIAVVLILMIMYEQVLRPQKQVIHWQGKPSIRFARFCYLLGLLIPVALIVGAAVGYYASVQQLRIQTLLSVAQVVVTLFVAGLLRRWIIVSRKRLAVLQAVKGREAALTARDQKEGLVGEKPQNVASLSEVKASAGKVAEVEEQTNRLVRAAAIAVIVFGLIGIWRSAIPALSAFDKVALWGEVGTAETTRENTPDFNPVGALTPQQDSSEAEAGIVPEVGQVITLQDVFLAIVILFLTFIAAKNIPGLLELAVFRHMNLAPGSSFAFTTTIRYIIVVVGLIMAFGKIGIEWGKVQWIAAAVTLGIGFGLQEIFANFVAGLIILFERPIRLGDIVTITGVDGKVTQIRIRATTVRQFNGRELIVPNKEFITGQFVNWTLSDSVLRVDVPVGIAYGSDTEKAKDLLMKAAEENPRVLQDPAPVVLFDNFADSSLAFILRAHIAGIEHLLAAKTELHFAVDKAFQEAGIEISFPQTDIHIRSMPEKDGTLEGK